MNRYECLVGQVAIVTGAAKGLGLGISRRLARDGMSVVLADVDEASMNAAAHEIGGAAGEVCDVADAEAVDRLVARTVSRHGRLDLMVANAGIGGGVPVAEMSNEAFRRIIAVNLEGTFYCCRAAARVMLAQRTGVIITVGSIFGQDTPPRSGAPVPTEHPRQESLPSPTRSLANWVRTAFGSTASARATWPRKCTGRPSAGGRRSKECPLRKRATVCALSSRLAAMAKRRILRAL